MKKSTWFALITVILIVLILQSFGSRIKIYEKQKKYIYQEEVIKDYLKNINFLWGDRGLNGEILSIIPNLDLYETISDRYRLRKEESSTLSYGEVPIFKEYIIENVTSSENRLLEENLDTYSIIEDYKKPKSSEIYKVSGKSLINTEKYTSDNVNASGEFISSESEDIDYEDTYIFLVVVDEGKGYVVDNYLGRYK